MNLLERRKQWEKGGEVALEVTRRERPETLGGTQVYPPTVFVILNFGGQSGYALHRYFPFHYGTDNEAWDVSVDKSGVMLDECLEDVTKNFQDQYPSLRMIEVTA